MNNVVLLRQYIDYTGRVQQHEMNCDICKNWRNTGEMCAEGRELRLKTALLWNLLRDLSEQSKSIIESVYYILITFKWFKTRLDFSRNCFPGLAQSQYCISGGKEAISDAEYDKGVLGIYVKLPNQAGLYRRPDMFYIDLKALFPYEQDIMNILSIMPVGSYLSIMTAWTKEKESEEVKFLGFVDGLYSKEIAHVT